ncbi:MAG: hypothetical protein P4L77_15875, partial [Sulfuriferula sp.]|nr:hypothetical protein [Sulfuriferula sp.]
DIMSEITAASREQSIGIEEVNRAISQMDETTQQNAALVEQAAAAAKSLQDQAGHLEELVYKFKLGDSAVSMSAKRPAASSAIQRRIAPPAKRVSVKHKTVAGPVSKLPAAGQADDEWETF